MARNLSLNTFESPTPDWGQTPDFTGVPPQPVLRQPLSARFGRVLAPREERPFRLRVALLMAFVSLTSAYVTYVATERGSAAAGLDAAASQQLAQEQQSAQQIDAWVAQDLRLTARIDEPLSAWRLAAAESNGMRASDPSGAATIDLRGQTDYDRMRVLTTYFRDGLSFDINGTTNYDAEGARNLYRVIDPRLFGDSSLATGVQATDARNVATWLVLVVVVLVGALFVLTLAHVAGPLRGRVLAAFGLLTAIVGSIAFAFVDLSAGRPLLVVGAALVAIVGSIVFVRRAEWLLAGLDEPAAVREISAMDFEPGRTATADPDARPTRYVRFAAVGLALITLLGAWLGFLHFGAASAADSAAWHARDLGVQSIGALRSAEEKLSVGVDTYELALDQRARAWSARQDAGLAESMGSNDEAQQLRQSAAEWDVLAGLSEARSGLADRLDAPGASGASDGQALSVLRAEVWRDAMQLAGEQDATNSASESWGGRAALYVSLLAWLGVAAYLLGLSLVFREHSVRVVLASVALVLIAAAGLRGGSAWLLESLPSDAMTGSAAADYAAGVVASQQNDWAGAEEAFTRAIETRPEFGPAHLGRAEAIMQAGSSQGAGLRSAFAPAAVDRALADFDAATEQGAYTAAAEADIGALLFHRALLTGSDATIEQSIVHSRRAIELGASFTAEFGLPHFDQVIAESNLGLALLSIGREDQARAAYAGMTADLRRLPEHLQRLMLSATLDDLELTKQAPRPVAEATIQRMKDLVIGQSYGAPPDRSARLSDARAELFPTIFQWRATISGFDPTRDTLVVEWYEYDAATGSWHGLPLVSGKLALGQPSLAGQFNLDPTLADAYWGNSTNELAQDLPARCVSPDRYRVELYLNGVLAKTAESEWTDLAYQPVFAHDLGIAICRPEDWQKTVASVGSSIGFSSPDGSRGLTVFRVHQPTTSIGGDPPSDPRAAALDRLVASGADGQPPGMLYANDFDGRNEATVLGRNDGLWRLYSFDSGVAKMVATYPDGDASKGLLVICIYGPIDWVGSSDASNLLLSVVER